jgi:hypothetical protein
MLLKLAKNSIPKRGEEALAEHLWSALLDRIYVEFNGVYSTLQGVKLTLIFMC